MIPAVSGLFAFENTLCASSGDSSDEELPPLHRASIAASAALSRSESSDDDLPPLITSVSSSIATKDVTVPLRASTAAVPSANAGMCVSHTAVPVGPGQCLS